VPIWFPNGDQLNPQPLSVIHISTPRCAETDRQQEEALVK